MLTDTAKFKFKFTLPFWLLVVIAILTPLDEYQRNILFGFSIQRITFFFVFHLFIIMLLIEIRKIYLSPLIVPLLLYLAAHFVGAYNADYDAAIKAVLRVSGYILLFIVVINLIRTRRQVLFILNSLIVALFSVELIAIFKIVTGSSILGLDIIELQQSMEYERIIRMKATSENPNEFGSLLVLSLPIVASLAFVYGKKYRKTFFLMFFVVGLICLFALQSRSALFGVSIALMVMGFHLFRKKAGRKSFSFLVLFILLTILGFTQIPQLQQMNVFARITDQRYYDLKEDKRIKIWKESVKFIAAHPLGAGVGNSARAIYEYSDEISRERPSHNVILATGVECGWIGVLAVLCLFAVIFFELKNAIKRVDRKTDKLLLIGFFASCLGFFIHNQFHSLLGWNVAWLIFGLAFATIRISKQTYVTALNG